MQRIFLTTAQAAVFMGVSKSAIIVWVKKGRIPVFVNRKMGKGGKNWYSITSLRNFKENEEYLGHRAKYEKAKDTMRAGVVKREVYKQQYKPRIYKKPVPEGWITVREAADLLDIGQVAVYNLIKRGHIEAQHFTGKWDAKCRPWFLLRSALERYIASEFYQRKHCEGKEAALKQIGISLTVLESDTAPKQHRELPELAPFYSREELMAHREQVASYIPNPDLW